MKILITGGAGFIGSNLATYLLEKKHQVVVLDNLRFGYLENLTSKNNVNFQFMHMDVRDRKIEKVFKDIDVIFHFAGMNSLPACQSNPVETFSVNVIGTANVLEIARKRNIGRVIFSSSSAVYENEKSFPLTENMQVNPTLAYSLSKKSAEEICRTYQELYGIDIVIFRFFNVYGPHMDWKRANPPVISYIINCLQNSKRPVLHSHGYQKRDMVYIDDVVRLCELVLTNKRVRNQTLNVGSGQSYTIKHLYKEITSQMAVHNISPIYDTADTLWNKYPTLFEGQFRFQKKFIEKEVNKRTLASIEQTKKLLKWIPMVNLYDGLQKTIQYAKKRVTT